MAAQSQPQSQELSEDTKTIITIIAFLVAYPIGLILMFVWTKWPVWVKILLTLPIFLFIAIMSLVMTLIFHNAQNRANQAIREKMMMEASSSGYVRTATPTASMRPRY